MSKRLDTTAKKLNRTEQQNQRYKEIDHQDNFMWELLRKRGSDSERKDSQKAYFPFFYDSRINKLRLPNMSWEAGSEKWVDIEEIGAYEIALYPIDENGIERRWRWGYDTAKKDVAELKVEIKVSPVIYYKFRQPIGVNPTTNWIDSKYSATEHGTGVSFQL